MFRHLIKDDPKFKSAGWSNNKLQVQYHSGDVRTCYNVSESEYEAFLNSNYKESEFKRLLYKSKSY